MAVESAEEFVELTRIGTAIFALVPEDMRADWVAYLEGNLDRNVDEEKPENDETVAHYIGRWFIYGEVLLPLNDLDKEAADVPLRPWSFTP